ncbi:MAG: SH3 domain-containing protein [Chloroflexi bacterium]|nr:SH3 domain-containing protein [Chloroflexota bacterium]
MTEYDSESTLQEEASPPSRRGMFLYATGMLVALAGVAFVLIWYTGSLDREPPGLPPVTTPPAAGTALPPAVSITSTVPPPAGSTPTAAPTPAQSTALVVANTGGQGVNLRAQPSTTARIVARLLDGTRLDVAGADVQAEGRTWKHVKDPAGNTGYIAAEFAAPAR